ncbi:MAG: type II toxin-antitoxin system mRNA interferase toxin, RelE/StbE family [Bacteriovoracia bacterium]
MLVLISRNARKDVRRAPYFIVLKFQTWFEIVTEDGIEAVQRVVGYRDHPLVGNRKGQRSSSLNRSWRVIYIIETDHNSVYVLEVTNHEY